MESGDERKRHLCVDCGATSPETQTNYTLISSQHGWRLSRRADENGVLVAEWRCPDCWQKFKQARPASGQPAVRPGRGASEAPRRKS